ncbi:flagellar motor switch protein FliN/FliY [Litorivivens lipolytica]|uniref:Flagellar motor switch protein FliN n=1 Tax=Litorivivens lipolytica TaxID=1524264 RepID=A0A7W4W2T9_9GAMM|nr:flagellar motor switch protein FliN [Litorivivens lipolytica]MBB3046359.1 flagellar motor switch protein FliN/FliY [Litorivivens lipolytica]
MSEENSQAAAPEMAELQDNAGGAGGDINLDMLLDVNVSLAIELGRSEMSIRDLLRLNQGSVVNLDRMAGEALDVLVNGTLVARGEIVVVKEKFGVKLTEVVSPEERVRRLN